MEEESPEDVRQRNIKEAEILASNLAEGGINSHEIISDVSQLKCLALLQESMVNKIMFYCCIFRACDYFLHF